MNYCYDWRKCLTREQRRLRKERICRFAVLCCGAAAVVAYFALQVRLVSAVQ